MQTSKKPMPEQLKPIHSQDDYREAMDKLGSYRAALIEAQRVADELDFLRVARIGQVPTENAVELADRLLSGEELQDDLGKRIAETARKIKTLKSAIEQQNAEVLRIRGEHSRIVCRAAVNEHAAIVGRILKAVEELDAANRAEIECRAGIERAGYSSTLLPPMASPFSPSPSSGRQCRQWSHIAGSANCHRARRRAPPKPRPCSRLECAAGHQ